MGRNPFTPSESPPAGSSTSPRARLGRAGEDAVAEHLRRRGYEILERNFSCRLGEIDLIARQGTTIVFVEVKTRSTDLFGSPGEAVRALKQTRVRRTAALWLHQNRPSGCDLRFDVASVIVRGGHLVVDHIEAAF